MAEWKEFEGGNSGKLGGYHFVKCSNCGNIGYLEFRYCPRCGTKMENAVELCDDCVNQEDPIRAECSVCSMKASKYTSKRLTAVSELHQCDGCDYFDYKWLKCKLHGDKFIVDVKCERKQKFVRL